MRIGFGKDIHPLEEGRRLRLGGIDIPSDTGPVGHSDGDALLHALTDSILGALALGDIGTHFPDNDPKWLNADSEVFLQEAVRWMEERGFALVNVDSTVSIERPKLRPHLESIRENIAEVIGIGKEFISVKAKSGNGIGAIGKGLAVKAEACVLLTKVGE